MTGGRRSGGPWKSCPAELTNVKMADGDVGYRRSISIDDQHNVHLVDATMFYAREGGGVSTYLTAKAKWLAKNTPIRHTIVAPAPEDAGCEHVPVESGGSVLTVPAVKIPYAPRSFRAPRSLSVAADFMCRLEPDLIEVGDPYHFAWAALKVKREIDVPLVTYYHSDLPALAGRRFGGIAEGATRRYLMQLYRRFDLVLAPSAGIAERLRDLGVENVAHQPLGVDTRLFSPDKRNDRLREQLGLPPETRLLVYAGRFTREKKLPMVIDAVHRLGKPYHLLLIGSGDRLPESSQCTFLPFQSDMTVLASLIGGCDMLVHGGDHETFGLVVLEAMACGIPVVGMAAGGVAELVDDETGLLVPPACARMLAEGIDALYRRDVAALGRNARRKAVERYDWSLIVPQLISHYAGLFASHQRAEFEADFQYATE